MLYCPLHYFTFANIVAFEVCNRSTSSAAAAETEALVVAAKHHHDDDKFDDPPLWLSAAGFVPSSCIKPHGRRTVWWMDSMDGWRRRISTDATQFAKLHSTRCPIYRRFHAYTSHPLLSRKIIAINRTYSQYPSRPFTNIYRSFAIYTWRKPTEIFLAFGSLYSLG